MNSLPDELLVAVLENLDPADSTSRKAFRNLRLTSKRLASLAYSYVFQWISLYEGMGKATAQLSWLADNNVTCIKNFTVNVDSLKHKFVDKPYKPGKAQEFFALVDPDFEIFEPEPEPEPKPDNLDTQDLIEDKPYNEAAQKIFDKVYEWHQREKSKISKDLFIAFLCSLDRLRPLIKHIRGLHLQQAINPTISAFRMPRRATLTAAFGVMSYLLSAEYDIALPSLETVTITAGDIHYNIEYLKTFPSAEWRMRQIPLRFEIQEVHPLSDITARWQRFRFSGVADLPEDVDLFSWLSQDPISRCSYTRRPLSPSAFAVHSTLTDMRMGPAQANGYALLKVLKLSTSLETLSLSGWELWTRRDKDNAWWALFKVMSTRLEKLVDFRVDNLGYQSRDDTWDLGGPLRSIERRDHVWFEKLVETVSRRRELKGLKPVREISEDYAMAARKYLEAFEEEEYLRKAEEGDPLLSISRVFG